MKLREICEAAKLYGLALGYPQFHSYVSRRRQRRSTSALRPPVAQTNPQGALPHAPHDAFSNLREQRQVKKGAGFEYNSFLDSEENQQTIASCPIAGPMPRQRSAAQPRKDGRTQCLKP